MNFQSCLASGVWHVLQVHESLFKSRTTKHLPYRMRNQTAGKQWVKMNHDLITGIYEELFSERLDLMYMFFTGASGFNCTYILISFPECLHSQEIKFSALETLTESCISLPRFPRSLSVKLHLSVCVCVLLMCV